MLLEPPYIQAENEADFHNSKSQTGTVVPLKTEELGSKDQPARKMKAKKF